MLGVGAGEGLSSGARGGARPQRGAHPGVSSLNQAAWAWAAQHLPGWKVPVGCPAVPWGPEASPPSSGQYLHLCSLPVSQGRCLGNASWTVVVPGWAESPDALRPTWSPQPQRSVRPGQVRGIAMC